MSIGEKLQTIAENEQKVYEAGFAAGQATGGDTDAAYQEGYDAGFVNGRDEGYNLGFEGGTVAVQKAEYDRFWDACQQNGNRTNYICGFAGYGWTEETFKPKYDIVPTIAEKIFDHHSEQRSYDLVERLIECGIKLDFSKCTNFTQSFVWSGVSHVGVVDTRSAVNISSLFYYASVCQKIDQLTLKDDGSQSVNNIFDGCISLTDISVSGKFGKNLKLSESKKLNHNSIVSIIEALLETCSGQTVALSLTAINTAFETSIGEADGSTSAEWLALVATKPNWTIILA